MRPWLILWPWFGFLNHIQGSDLVVKVDPDVPVPADCAIFVNSTKDFFWQASTFLYEATTQLDQFESVTFEFPPHWNDSCAAVASKGHKVPVKAANILVKAKANTRAKQGETCAHQGLYVDLNLSFSSNSRKSFVAEFIKYNFGVFDEHGDGSKMYPMFYSKVTEVRPNSCSDVPVTGNFSQECLNSPELCPFNQDQVGVTSSITFSVDFHNFPKMTKVCNAENHDQDSPNQQNLLCDYRSVLEVIQLKTGRRGKAFTPPKFNFVQNNNLGEMIVVLDASMSQGRYKTMRVGLEQLFVSLRGQDRSLTVIQNTNEGLEIKIHRNSTDLPSWNLIFPPVVMSTVERLNLEDTFNIIKTSYLDTYPDIPFQVIVLTATDEFASENLTNAIQVVNDGQVQVDIWTFNSIRHPKLLELAKFGNVMAIPEQKNQMIASQFVGTGLVGVASDVMNLNMMQVVHQQHEIPGPLYPTLEGSFELLPTMTSLSNAYIVVMILVPWEHVSDYPRITVTDPNGRLFTNEFPQSISSMWSGQVWFCQAPTFVAGQWNYTIRRINENTEQPIFVQVYVDVGQGLQVTGHLEALARTPLDAVAKDIFALAFMADMKRPSDDSNTYNISATISHAADEDITIRLKDDGLTVPDVTTRDDVYSQYFYNIYHRGFYTVRYELTNANDIKDRRYWVGPSFYVTVPVDQSQGDRIPPSRITDLRVSQNHDVPTEVTLEWTAPGDDWNEGQAHYYRIFCGPSRTSLSYTECFSFRRNTLLVIAGEAGSSEFIKLNLSVVNEEVYIGIKAYDNDNNAGAMSNLPSVFAPGVTTTRTTTTTTSTTRSSAAVVSTQVATESNVTGLVTNTITPLVASTLPPGLQTTTKKPGVYLTTAGFTILIIFTILIFIALMIMVFIYVRRRKNYSKQLREREEQRRRPRLSSKAETNTYRRNRPDSTLSSETVSSIEEVEIGHLHGYNETSSTSSSSDLGIASPSKRRSRVKSRKREVLQLDPTSLQRTSKSGPIAAGGGFYNLTLEDDTSQMPTSNDSSLTWRDKRRHYVDQMRQQTAKAQDLRASQRPFSYTNPSNERQRSHSRGRSRSRSKPRMVSQV